MAAKNDYIIEEFLTYLRNAPFPCIGAKATVSRSQLKCMVSEHIACPHEDHAILNFIYRFVDTYRRSDQLFHSAAVIFKNPQIWSEEMFDRFMWQRLQNLSDMDARYYGYDRRVNTNPESADFSFSLKSEAFFIIGLHPASSRQSRRFAYPVLVFNPHVQFEQLRQLNRYTPIKNVIRKRDKEYSGSVNPMLTDFGDTTEARQYSGRNYSKDWQCPFKSQHGKFNSNTAA